MTLHCHTTLERVVHIHLELCQLSAEASGQSKGTERTSYIPVKWCEPSGLHQVAQLLKPKNIQKTIQNPSKSMHVLDSWTTVEPLLDQDTTPRWAPAVVSGSFQGFGAAQRHQQHEERPRRRREHRAQALHGAAVGVPVHFGVWGAAPQLMMRTKHFSALSTSQMPCKTWELTTAAYRPYRLRMQVWDWWNCDSKMGLNEITIWMAQRAHAKTSLWCLGVLHQSINFVMCTHIATSLELQTYSEESECDDQCWQSQQSQSKFQQSFHCFACTRNDC